MSSPIWETVDYYQLFSYVLYISSQANKLIVTPDFPQIFRFIKVAL